MLLPTLLGAEDGLPQRTVLPQTRVALSGLRESLNRGRGNSPLLSALIQSLEAPVDEARAWLSVPWTSCCSPMTFAVWANVSSNDPLQASGGTVGAEWRWAAGQVY